MNFVSLLEKMKNFSTLIDGKFDEIFSGDVNPIDLIEPSLYALKNGGKRLRSFICYEIATRMGADSEKSLQLATAIEIMHNWMLIHDDIEDGDVFRRNKLSVWKKFGLPNAINIGDYLAHKVFEIILSMKDLGLDEKNILNLNNLAANVAIKTI